MKKKNTMGQVFTPAWVADEMLDIIDYRGVKILDKYVLEPSCGDGSFLCKIVDRYVDEAVKNNFDIESIQLKLERYVVGIEYDVDVYWKCIENLNSLIKNKLGSDITIKWNIHLDNTLFLYKRYLNYFDYVIGNPPYIRIHDLTVLERIYIKNNFMFSSGSLNSYIVFYEIGFNVLKSDGKLCYITPNSYLRNTSYQMFREYIKNTNCLHKLIDFKSNKIFDGISVYPSIMYFDNGIKTNNFDYFEYVDGEITKINTIELSGLNTRSWVFSNKDDSLFVDNFNKCDSNSVLGDYFNIQHGFATLRDSVFISKHHAFVDYYEGVCLFNGFLIENALVRPIVKGSKYRGNPDDYSYIIYPYEKIDGRWVVIGEEKLKTKYPMTYSYFLSHKDELLKRDSDKNALWYEFGRSQGVQTMHGEKIVCDTMVNDRVLFYKLPDDVMVYSGVFITKKTEYEVSWDLIENVLKSKDFLRYIKITGKDFSGNYKSISTKQIKNYKIACDEM